MTARTDIGGGPKSVLMLSKYLPEEFDIYIACPTDLPYYDLYLQTKRVKDFYPIPHRKFTLGKYVGLIRFVWKNNIQLINSNGTGAGFYVRLLKLFCWKPKVIHTFRGVNTKHIGSIKNRVYFLYEKLFSYLTDRFINVSYGEQNLCVSMGILRKEQSVVIHNGLEGLKKNVAFNENQLAGKFVITTLSRFDYPKNMFDSYKIASALKEYTDIVFLWIGDGEDKEKLEQLSKENNVNIYFAGFRTNVADYLSVTDLYLSTSIWEGLPLALLEASSMGIPMVASDIIGNNEVVKNDVNGFLFKPGDIDEAVRIIVKLYNDKNLYYKLSEASKNIFLENFSVEIMTSNTARLFRNMLN